MSESPLPGFRFVVELDDAGAYLPPDQAQLIPQVGAEDGFQEVTGLGAELEVAPYAEGGLNGFAHQLPVRHTWNRITLKRGIVSNRAIWLWYQAGLTQSLGARRGGSITLQQPDGEVSVTWAFIGGLVVKWNGPDLHATQGAVAVESIEIAHEGLYELP